VSADPPAAAAVEPSRNTRLISLVRESPRTRKQARPDVRLPTARAAGVTELPILIDTRERYAYKFTGQQVSTTKKALACGDYAVEADGAVVASVKRKSLADLVSSLINGTLRYPLGELATLPRATVVVEDRYTQHSLRCSCCWSSCAVSLVGQDYRVALDRGDSDRRFAADARRVAPAEQSCRSASDAGCPVIDDG